MIPPSVRADRAFALGALGLHALAAALDPSARPLASLSVALVAAALALVAARSGGASARRTTALMACVSLAMCAGLLWQLAMLTALAGYALLVWRSPTLALPEGWRSRGRLPLWETALTGGVTPFALVAWLALAHPDLGDLLRSPLLRAPLPLLVLGAVLFALVNAALEEALWRGGLQSALEPAWGWRGAVALQALSFGAQHAHGFPRGLVGVALAGSWGAMLGLLRRRSGGLLAPFIAHVVADATIAVLVLQSARG